MLSKQTRTLPPSPTSTRRLPLLAAAACFTLTLSVSAQTPARPSYPVPTGGFGAPAPLQLPALPATAPITPNGAVVEDVIARVNDQIITRSEYDRSRKQILQEAQQQNVAPAELQDRLSNLLRDMIDQQILLSKGKDLGISGDAETMRQLDEIRKQNHLDSMEALEKAAQQQGVSFEDFKQRIRNQAITQQVVREEVGRRLNMTHTQEETYYAAHSKEFEVPEQVHLSEILIPTTDTATEAEIAAAQAKADEVAAKLKAGAKFSDVAKSSSGGPTASAGGDLGDFKRGTLGDVLENATFSLPAGGFTAPIRTRQGFVILRVDSHQAAGSPPLADVEPQVQEAIYLDALQPALRAYLSKARQDAYVDIKPGFVDTGSMTTARLAKPVFTAYAPPKPKKKNLKHQQAEQERAAAAQRQLAAAREKVAEKNAEKAAVQAAKNAAPGAKNANKPVKPPKIHREKIRYGQAPRNALPAASVETAVTASAPLAGQAPGVAMSMNEGTTVISTGTAADDADALTPQAPVQRKTRYTQRQTEANEARLETRVAKADTKAAIRPVAATPDATATEKQQAAPLGLNGDTEKKKPKVKRHKGDPKERLQAAPARPAEAAPAPAPTVNPALAATPGATTTSAVHTDAPATKSPAPSADTTTLPPANTPPPGASPVDRPIPATTSAEPNQPATNPVPH